MRTSNAIKSMKTKSSLREHAFKAKRSSLPAADPLRECHGWRATRLPSKPGRASRFLGGSLQVRCLGAKRQLRLSPQGLRQRRQPRTTRFCVCQRSSKPGQATASCLQTGHERHTRTFRDLAPEAEGANHQAAAGTGVSCPNRVGLPTQSAARLP
jgi:hypothetical protein